jgi:O-succinylhomoserine sulfhydrylase
MSEDPHAWETATRLIRGGTMRTAFNETSEALFLTQSFVYDTAESAVARFNGEEPGYVYSRFANPTVQMFEDRLALLEGAQSCRAQTSGMAAVHASLMGLLRAGDHLVAGRALFGSCRWIVAEWLPRFGVETTMVDATDLKAWEDAIRPNTKVFLIETPANPLLEITDIAAVSKLAKAAGAKVVVDNVFATPIFQKPLELGADVVVYSATKHIDGQGRVLGGAILGQTELLDEAYRDMLRHTGPALSPFNAFQILQGLETLPLRMAQHCKNAAAVAQFLAKRPEVSKVIHPSIQTGQQRERADRYLSGGYGGLVGFELAGGREAGRRFIDGLKLFYHVANIGDARSLAIHPATTTHSQLSPEEQLASGVSPGYVRLSIGIEHIDDILADLDQALLVAA